MFEIVFLALAVLVTVSMLGQRRLRRELQDLRQRLDQLEGGAPGGRPPVPATTPAPAEAPTQLATTVAAAPASDLAPSPAAAELGAAPEPPPPGPPAQPLGAGALVFSAARLGALARFLRRNWVYVVAAASLALAGLFLVQYGIEKGLLTPPRRVLAALGLGLGMVGWGERLRRRPGLAAEARLLPSTFSGAGLAVIFAAVLAARQLYGLIGPAATFAGLTLTGAGAIWLGWFNAPLLIALGLLGAAAAPFLTGGRGPAPDWFFAYYGLIAAVGLGVDTIRRLAWLSALGLGLAAAGAALTLGAGGGTWAAALFALALPLLATALPERGLTPRQAGPTLAELRLRSLPPFPVRLVAGSLAFAVVLLVHLAMTRGDGYAPAVAGLTALTVLFLLWAARAPGLADQALLPALAFLFLVIHQAWSWGPVYEGFAQAALALRPAESPAPWAVTGLVALAALQGAAAVSRALMAGGALARPIGVVGLALPAAAALALDLFWAPALVLGDFLWALHALALATLAVGAALAFARRDGQDRLRVAVAALMALALIALAAATLLSGAALNLALAALILAAAGLDRRFDLGQLGLFAQAAVAVLTYRLLVEPGPMWDSSVPWPEFFAAFLGPIAACVAALRLLGPRHRPATRGTLESAAVLWGANFADAWLFRWIEAREDLIPVHMGIALVALPWLATMLAQLYRQQQTKAFRRLRRGLALFSGLLGLGLAGLAATVLSPLVQGKVAGGLLANSLSVAYLIPGLMLLAGALALVPPWAWARWLMLITGGALVAYDLALEIRHFWWGADIGLGRGLQQGELYTYTLALMLAGAGLLALALARRSDLARRLAMGAIALTIAKVFLVDASGLTGLTRVVSFLGLGLSLAGLAWLNAVIERAARAAKAAPSDPAAPDDRPSGP